MTRHPGGKLKNCATLESELARADGELVEINQQLQIHEGTKARFFAEGKEAEWQKIRGRLRAAYITVDERVAENRRLLNRPA
jgi:hypothetical protein